MNRSLGTLMAIGFAGLQLLAVLLVVTSSYLTTERTLIRHARDLLREVGINTTAHSKGFLRPAEGAAELAARLAENRVVESDDPALLEKLLFQQLQITPQFAGLYYGSQDGGFVYVMRVADGSDQFRTKIITTDGDRRATRLIWRNSDFSVISEQSDPADPYDPRTRPWYIKAMTEKSTIWTDPYIFFTSQHPGITLAAPVLRQSGEVRGVIGVDIEISMISDFLSKLTIGTNGTALIINHNGDVIAHPDQSLIKVVSSDGSLRFSGIDELDDPIARAAFGPLALAGAFPVTRELPSQFEYQGASYVSSIMPVMSEELPWTIAVYAPEDDFTGALKENRKQNIWLAGLAAAVTGAIGLLLAEYIHRPVRAFAVRTALVSQGEIDPDAPMPKTYQELERANSALVNEIVARREAELEYGKTFSLSSQGMAQIAPATGAFIRTNARFREITGFAEEELSGLPFADIIHPDEVLPPHLFDGAAEADNTVNRQLRCIRKDGRTIWATINTVLIRDRKGNLLHTVLMLEDITGAKSSEAQIERLNKDLSHLARGNTMGQMAKGLAHELNQPLTAIAQNADTALLILSQDQIDRAELQEILVAIENQSLRAGNIIHALRNFIQKGEKEHTEFDFGDLLKQTLQLVRPEANDARVSLSVELAPALPKVIAHRVQIAQVLVNLLHNAIEALSSHDVRDRHVTIHAAVDGRQLRVSVQDNGSGIAAGLNLFSQFETTKSAGMGLGLSICQSIVEANGGEIWHESVPGSGARFLFTLPVPVRPDTTPPAAQAHDRSKTSADLRT